MKKFIFEHDTWHFVIPFAVLSIQIPLAIELTLYTLLGLISLQFINEWLQFTDSKMIYKYSSYANFVKNTKKDTKYFIGGLFFGSFLGVLIHSVVV